MKSPQSPHGEDYAKKLYELQQQQIQQRGQVAKETLGFFKWLIWGMITVVVILPVMAALFTYAPILFVIALVGIGYAIYSKMKK